jgi:hypothetical protein
MVKILLLESMGDNSLHNVYLQDEGVAHDSLLQQLAKRRNEHYVL